MDTEDDNIDGGLNKLDESVTEKIVTASAGDLGQYGIFQLCLNSLFVSFSSTDLC